MMQCNQVGKIRKAFTLIEMLVVLLIIGILAAILFPVLKSAKESAYQASCATNLHQIYLAVELYRQDEGGYPGSLAALLGDTDNLAGYTTAGTNAGAPSLNTGGKGYFKGGTDALLCSDDDTTSTLPRSSYGDISTDISTTLGPTNDFGRYVWNFLGYRVQADVHTAACTDSNVSQCLGASYTAAAYGTGTSSCPSVFSNNCVPSNYVAAFQTVQVNGKYPYLMNPDAAWDVTANPVDITKFPRLVNRFAPPSTIITQCVFHRLPTSNAVGNYDIYNADGSGQGARGIILRLDGTAKSMDVTTTGFATGENWALQNF
ncbi:MAG: prepilin-type N-terminal cleavage/methylation domain-containing protein [Abditibacteriaceae bacterium]